MVLVLQPQRYSSAGAGILSALLIAGSQCLENYLALGKPSKLVGKMNE